MNEYSYIFDRKMNVKKKSILPNKKIRVKFVDNFLDKIFNLKKFIFGLCGFTFDNFLLSIQKVGPAFDNYSNVFV